MIPTAIPFVLVANNNLYLLVAFLQIHFPHDMTGKIVQLVPNTRDKFVLDTTQNKVFKQLKKEIETSQYVTKNSPVDRHWSNFAWSTRVFNSYWHGVFLSDYESKILIKINSQWGKNCLFYNPGSHSHSMEQAQNLRNTYWDQRRINSCRKVEKKDRITDFTLATPHHTCLADPDYASANWGKGVRLIDKQP